MSLRGRVALVSGAASGIGAATTALLAESGVHVHGVDIDSAGLSQHRDVLTQRGLESSYTAIDIAEESAVARVIEDVVSRCGALDIVVAAHGINSVDDDRIGELDTALFHRIVDVNLGGVIYLAKHSFDPLIRSDSGVFLAVSSIAAHLAPAGPAYAAAKGGISSLTRILAAEFASRGTRCVSVTPGAIDTPMMRRALDKRGEATMTMPPWSLPRVGQPDDVARLIRFLVSDDASYITGSNVTIDGGLTPF